MLTQLLKEEKYQRNPTILPEAGFNIHQPHKLKHMFNFKRYKRQILIDGWGTNTQEKLSNSKVFIAGAGGLGCPVALNLTSAGVGNITLCDSDTVDISNLNRQFLHAEKNIGVDKTISAIETLSQFNSSLNFTALSCQITADNVNELVADADIILDCLDNFPARYALNQCAIHNHIPLVHGAVWGMEGRVTVFHPPTTPCLSCLFPVVPAQQEEIPILGVVTCATGSLQAMEALHYLRGSSPTLQGKMLITDYSAMQFQTLEVPINPDCTVCSHLH
jgi:adenylyltransferase/sulfurtransferase